jgi:hypothetical protein
MVRHAFVALGLSLASIAAASSARAQQAPPEDAERRADALFFEARQLMAAGKYGEACPKLAEASHAHPGIGVLLNLGDCDAHVGKVGSAWNAFREAAEVARSASDEREKEARTRMAELEPHLNRLTVQMPPQSDASGLDVRLDGAPLDRAAWGTAIVVDPGMHTLEAQAAGRKRWSQSLEILAPTTTVAIPSLELDAPPPPPTATTAGIPPASDMPPESSSGGLDRRVLALSVGGVGIVGVAVGSVFGLLSISHKSVGNAHCQLGANGNECDPQGVQARSDAITAGDISTVAYIVGAVGLAAGAVLWFTAPPKSSGPTVGVAAGIGSAQLVGVW